ncbi:MAG: YbjN domain-containing protein [Ilumatobacteraceae bacterium]
MTDWYDDPRLDAVEASVDGWLTSFRTTNPAILAIDRNEPSEPERRWYVRMAGEEKEVITIWLTLGQRTLKYETYVLPAPEEQHREVYEYALRQNAGLVGCHFCIGGEDAIYLRGELPLAALDEEELDRVIGTLWVTVERFFRTLLRLAFASRFAS